MDIEKDKLIEELVSEFPFLKSTCLYEVPEGWLKTFFRDLCQEMQDMLVRHNCLDGYKVTQTKEKYGTLRWYDNGIPEDAWDEYMDIQNKYERISWHTCCHCGEKATKISQGWISPWCDECTHLINSTFKDLKD